MLKEMCPRFDLCHLRPLNGDGCEKGEEINCELFEYIESRLSAFGKAIEENLNGRGSFSYKEPWYKEAKKDLLGGGLLVTEKEFKRFENKIVDEFLISKRG